MTIDGANGDSSAPGPAAPADGAPSSSTKSRPSTTRTPSSEKRFVVTLATVTCSGFPSSPVSACRVVETPAIPARCAVFARRSFRSPGTTEMSRASRLRKSLVITNSRFGLAYGSGRSSTALVTLKIALLAPIPSARVRTAVTVNAGFLRSERAPIAKSRNDMCVTTPAVSALSQNGRVVRRPDGLLWHPSRARARVWIIHARGRRKRRTEGRAMNARTLRCHRLRNVPDVFQRDYKRRPTNRNQGDERCEIPKCPRVCHAKEDGRRNETISTELVPFSTVSSPTDGSRLNRRGPAAPGFTTNRPPTREIF